MSKADYVRAQPQTRRHTCHWPGCTVQVQPAKWGCKAHWVRLPIRLRNKLWNAYQPGQEEGRAPVSDAYLAAAAEIREWALSRGGSR